MNIVIEYYYDNLGRIVREDNMLAGTTYVYEYNADGNMANRKAYVYGSYETEDLIDETYYEYSNQWKDQLSDISGMKISYDEIGNPISYRDGMEFVWAGKMLSGVKGTDEIEFTYNHEGIRTSKTVNGNKTEYVIEGKDIIFEVSEEETVAYIYDSDMNVVGMIIGDETYYFEKNVQSDVLRILDDKGNVLCEYVYDAWGNVVCINGDEELAGKNPFRYRSYYYDVETGLYYAESRYYDPVVGRFINADKIEEIIWDYTNLNMYAYCGNDPVNYYDPSGEAAVSVGYLVARDMHNNIDLSTGEYANYGSSQYRASITLWLSELNVSTANRTYIIDGKQDFYDTWNTMIYANVVIIDAHGSPTTLAFNGQSVTVNEILNELGTNNIKFVWLLACNTGHQDFRNSNIAAAIAARITGVVVASDGTVGGTYKTYSGDKYKNFIGKECISAVSKPDGTWKKYSPYRPYSQYWVIYDYNRLIEPGYPVLYSWGERNITIFDVAEYLETSRFVSFK